MDLKATLSELTALKESWGRLASVRAGEVQASDLGYGSLNGGAVQEVIGDLLEIVQAYVTRMRAADKSGIALVDGASVRILRELRGWVDASQSNGVAWLLRSTEFLPKLVLARSMLRQAIARDVDINSRIARLATEQVHGDLTAVQDAAEAARVLIGKADEIAESEERVVGARDEVEAARGEVDSKLQQAKVLAEQLINTKADILKTSEEIQIAKEAVDAAKTAAEADTLKLQSSVSDLNERIDTASARTKEATEQLDKALKDARRQGLAKAFSDRHTAARTEYLGWVIAFAIIIAVLAALGVFQFYLFYLDTKFVDNNSNAIIGTNGLYAVLRRILSELPLAIPLIWAGWYSAKRIGMVSRLAQDYEYKAATALAFESYKKEVSLLGGGELSEQLLSTTIKNFGDNPVRLTDAIDKNHAHPLEALADSLKDEKAFDRLLKLVDRLRK